MCDLRTRFVCFVLLIPFLSYGLACNNKSSDLTPLEIVQKTIRQSEDSQVKIILSGKDFEVVAAWVLEVGNLFCIVHATEQFYAIVFSKEGKVLHIESRINFSPEHSPVFVTKLKGQHGGTQIIIPVPVVDQFGQVDLKILECKEGKIYSQTVARYIVGYVEQKKTYGLFPIVVSFNSTDKALWIVRKSKSTPFESVKTIMWDREKKEYNQKDYGLSGLIEGKTDGMVSGEADGHE